MKFILPLPPNMANDGRVHWRRKHSAQKLYAEKCGVWALTRNDRAILHFGPVSPARIKATLYVWSMMDQDNLLARRKWPVDWLVKSGYLEGDDPKRLRWDGIPEQVVDRKNMRLEIEIRPAA